MKTTVQYGKEADLALSLWVKLARASSLFTRLSARDIERYGLTQPQFSVVEALGHLGPMTTGDLGKKMLVTGGCMTVILDNLERDGVVERVRSVEDRRVVTVGLTTKGTELFERIFRQHATRITELASVLTVEEQQQLSDLLKKLGLALKEVQ
ncbi:MAG TPA: MarR family transcriptional regulator [Bacteroidetes bacterium]|nr:MarR family transcriptional regulator [Bacteroidota bacterium]